MQQAMLLESSIARRPWVNLEQVVIEGALPVFDDATLRSAWDTLCLRHDALRMTLVQGPDGRIAQHVLREARVDIRRADLAQVGGLAAFLAADRLAGIDATTRPGWRLTVLQGDAGRVVMVWTIHHALIDGASLATVLHELGILLQAAPATALPAAPGVSFAGFARHLPGIDTAEARAFFAGMFADAYAPLAISALGDAPAPTRSRMQLVSGALTPVQTGALRQALRGLGGTTLNAVQLAWALVQARWSGQDEATFGLVDSGRGLMPGLEGTVGCLISTLPLRVRLSGSAPVAQVLAGLRQTTLAMRAHAHVSPSEVRRWAGLPGQVALFDSIVMYAHETLHERLCRLDPFWQSCPVSLHEEGSAAATLAVTGGTALQLLLEHDPDRLPGPVAQAMLDQVRRVLLALAAGEDETRIADLDMLSPDETRALLSLGRPEAPLAPALPCIATAFEAMAARTPDAPALVEVATGQAIGYQALDQAANALAQRLHLAGVGAEDIVGLHLPRGADLVTAMLAVWKLGAAFLPLDPDLPADWLADLMARAGARALIAPPGSPLQAALRLSPGPAGAERHAPPRPAPDPDRSAYVLFTSGTTGQPKPVRGTQGALAAHGAAVIAAFGLGPTDRVLHFAGPGFDVALEEIVPTLLCGACLVIRPPEAAGSPRAFWDVVAAEKVSVLNLPASFWHVLVEDMTTQGQRPPPDLRLLVTGSERVAPQALHLWRQRVPDVVWMNGYGPTETTITATVFALSPGAAAPQGDIPIGRPLAHASVVLRAFDGTLTPRGGVGGLWIGGAAVSGGYLDKTPAADGPFQPDPWTQGARLYRTGDQARWQADGQLAFLGRHDRQIKLRGQRIDLHQVETLLATMPGLGASHVGVQTDAEGRPQRLVAWLVAERPDDLPRLDRALASRLPPALRPALVAVPHLPTKANGKIDTAALPAPDEAAPAPKDIPDADPLTRRIAALMAQVLGRPHVPADAAFSDLGGDSLLGLRLVSLIEAETGHALQTAHLHQHGSAAALARLVAQGAQARPRLSIPIQPQGTRPAFFAIHVLGRNEELFRPLSAALGPDQPMFGLSVGIPRNLDDISVERTARLYFDEIQTFHPQGPVCLGAVSMAAYFAYELAQLLRAAGREVRVLVVLDAMGPDGRPALTGAAKLRAHLGQVRRHGLWHFARILRNRLDRYREHREALRAAPDQINPHTLIAANVLAVEFYRPQPYDGPLTVFRADHSFWDSPEALATGLGWASVARGGLALIDLPGTHLSILQPGNVQVLASHLRPLIGR